MNIFTNIINFFGTGADAVNTIGNEWSQDDEGSGHLTASDGRREGGNTIQRNINSGSTTNSGGAVPDIDEGDIASSIIDILQSQKRKLTKRERDELLHAIAGPDNNIEEGRAPKRAKVDSYPSSAPFTGQENNSMRMNANPVDPSSSNSLKQSPRQGGNGAYFPVGVERTTPAPVSAFSSYSREGSAASGGKGTSMIPFSDHGYNTSGPASSSAFRSSFAESRSSSGLRPPAPVATHNSVRSSTPPVPGSVGAGAGGSSYKYVPVTYTSRSPRYGDAHTPSGAGNYSVRQGRRTSPSMRVGNSNSNSSGSNALMVLPGPTPSYGRGPVPEFTTSSATIHQTPVMAASSNSHKNPREEGAGPADFEPPLTRRRISYEPAPFHTPVNPNTSSASYQYQRTPYPRSVVRTPWSGSQSRLPPSSSRRHSSRVGSATRPSRLMTSSVSANSSRITSTMTAPAPKTKIAANVSVANRILDILNHGEGEGEGPRDTEMASPSRGGDSLGSSTSRAAAKQVSNKKDHFSGDDASRSSRSSALGGLSGGYNCGSVLNSSSKLHADAAEPASITKSSFTFNAAADASPIPSRDGSGSFTFNAGNKTNDSVTGRIGGSSKSNVASFSFDGNNQPPAPVSRKEDTTKASGDASSRKTSVFPASSVPQKASSASGFDFNKSAPVPSMEFPAPSSSNRSSSEAKSSPRTDRHVSSPSNNSEETRPRINSDSDVGFIGKMIKTQINSLKKDDSSSKSSNGNSEDNAVAKPAPAPSSKLPESPFPGSTTTTSAVKEVISSFGSKGEASSTSTGLDEKYPFVAPTYIEVAAGLVDVVGREYKFPEPQKVF